MPAGVRDQAAGRTAGPGRGRPHRVPLALSAMLALSLLGESTAVAAASAGDDPPAEVHGMPDLRALFRSEGGRDARRVGRVAVQLVRGETIRRTGMDHPFRSGDTFRFEIASNQAGWLYVLHRSPAGEPQLLWPRMAAGRHLDDNRVWAGETTLVPPAPDVFLFDDEVGSEYFYVVIRPDRQAPELSVLDLPEPPQNFQPPEPRPVVTAQPASSGQTALAVAAPAKQKIVQFSVRSMRGEQAPMRGVVLLPGGGDPDPNAYFAPDPRDRTESVVYEFRLRHRD